MSSNLSHSEKIFYAKSDLAYNLNLLDREYGILATIKRVHSKCYQVAENFEVTKEYKRRASARAYIKRLLLQKYNGE